MHMLILGPRTFFVAKFGRCAKCMRLALHAAFLALAGVAIAYWASPGSALFYFVLLAAAGLTLLAFAHILMFAAGRVAAARNAGRQVGASGAGQARAPIPVLFGRRLARPVTRRDTLWIFVRGAAAAAMASLPLLRPAMASCGDCAAQFGAGTLDCITNFCSTQGQVCCPPGYPYLNHCDCICYDGTNFDCGSYSNCNYCG